MRPAPVLRPVTEQVTERTRVTRRQRGLTVLPTGPTARRRPPRRAAVPLMSPSVGGGTEPSARSSAQPAANATPVASGAPGRAAEPDRPAKTASDSPLARTGASLSAGALALALLVVGYLILRRRRQVD